MTGQRKAWTTIMIRAEDVEGGDVVKIDGIWRWVFDAWDSGDGEQVEEQFGPGDLTEAIRRVVDNDFNLWTAVRYLIGETSTDCADYKIAKLQVHDLVELQVPVASVTSTHPVGVAR